MTKVLVVEDDKDLCETYIDILEVDHHDVHIAGSSAEAIQHLSRAIPDVVLLDMQLPGESGILVLAFIRRFKRLKHTKVIVVSGLPEMARKAVADWGADMFVPKPIDPIRLRTTIQLINPSGSVKMP